MLFMFNELTLQQEEEHLSHLERVKQTLEDLRNDTRCDTVYDEEEAQAPVVGQDEQSWWDWWY